MELEKQRIESISRDSLYTTACNLATIKYCYEIFRRHLVPGNILELGPAEGIMTEYLYSLGREIVLVEGSDTFCKALSDRYSRAEIVNSLFEDLDTEKKFNNIILGHILEHVENPADILKKVKKWLAPQGVIMTAVPNSNSIHRQAAVLLNILPTEKSMSELDHHHGHRRIYDPEMLKGQIEDVGFKIKKIGGYWLKPLSNNQIHETWTPEMLYAFMVLGERYPDIAAEIYVIATV